ncbi:MAG TPA: ribonuclease HII [Blastocatellia bacterium]|nr:ribonuclease HII [Blastocatellia bacterium]
MACGTDYESKLWESGFRLIAGADEVGRGALAGPVVAAAVILNPVDIPEGLDDSKRLTRAQREALAPEIMGRAVSYAVARIEPEEIDRINIFRASLRAMDIAVKALRPPADYVLIDGCHRVPTLSCPQMAIVKGDSISASIAAASIIAKVARDRWMEEYDRQYPGYGFATHVGYATRTHREAILRLGPSAIHRMTFHGVLPIQAAFDY